MVFVGASDFCVFVCFVFLIFLQLMLLSFPTFCSGGVMHVFLSNWPVINRVDLQVNCN